MKGKKLPVVWVELDEESDGCLVPYAVRPYASVGAVRYTPAKPAKQCRWTLTSTGLHDTQCERFGLYLPLDFVMCPYCGGKIQVTR